MGPDRADGGARDDEFSAFVLASSRGLHRYGYLLTGSTTDAEELVQETLVRVYLAWHRITRDGSPMAYTRTAMARTHISRWRSRSRRTAVEDRVTLDRSITTPGIAWDSATADRDAVWTLLGTLPPRQRAVVVLRFYEDLAEKDIAATLGCSVGTVKSQLSRALASLRQHPSPLTLVDERQVPR